MRHTEHRGHVQPHREGTAGGVHNVGKSAGPPCFLNKVSGYVCGEGEGDRGLKDAHKRYQLNCELWTSRQRGENVGKTVQTRLRRP